MANINLACIHASNAARYLAMAARGAMDGKPPGWEYEDAIRELTDVCNRLGYVLVRTDAEGASEKPASDETEAA
ncbi:MAG: hypothetical protein QG602_951 [Verrucomicrobiota bacterium]|nr:hypothetical protein [Verrucomicrobiota bacterium]